MLKVPKIKKSSVRYVICEAILTKVTKTIIILNKKVYTDYVRM